MKFPCQNRGVDFMKYLKFPWKKQSVLMKHLKQAKVQRVSF
ncbi:hypothetical protein CsSME_00004997 [Camellia sinensis var. sinensis]